MSLSIYLPPQVLIYFRDYGLTGKVESQVSRIHDEDVMMQTSYVIIQLVAAYAIPPWFEAWR